MHIKKLSHIKTQSKILEKQPVIKKENTEEQRQNTGLARSTTFESVTIQVKE